MKAVAYNSSKPEIKVFGDYIYTVKINGNGEVFFTAGTRLYNVTSGIWQDYNGAS